MVKFLLSLLVLLVVSFGTAFSQSHTLSLRGQNLEDMPRKFYIAEVLDTRVVKSSIGLVQLVYFRYTCIA